MDPRRPGSWDRPRERPEPVEGGTPARRVSRLVVHSVSSVGEDGADPFRRPGPGVPESQDSHSSPLHTWGSETSLTL